MAIRKPLNFGPVYQTSKDRVRDFDTFHGLDKRIQSQIDASARANMTEVFFLGYYINGGDASVAFNPNKFKSPIDNYQYQQSQVKYQWALYSTRTVDPVNPDGSPFQNGQLLQPARAILNSGAGQLFWMNFDVNQDTGIVTTIVSYYVTSAAETITNDGVLAVTAICSRGGLASGSSSGSAATSGTIRTVIRIVSTTNGALTRITITGAIDGLNQTFNLSPTPNPSTSLILVEDGLVMKEGVDFTLAVNVVTMTVAPPIGTNLLAWGGA